MDLEQLRPHLERAAREEGLELSRLDLSPDGRTVIVGDASGEAAIPVSPLESVDLGSDSAFTMVARAFADRTYSQVGEQEYLETEALSPDAMRNRLPEHPGHLGADYSAPPSPTARAEPEPGAVAASRSAEVRPDEE